MTTENNAAPTDEAAQAAAAAAAAEAAQKTAPLDLNPDGTPKAPAALPVATETPAEAEVVVYNPTGDAGLDLALKFVGEHGFKPDHPAMQAAVKGDFSLLEAELAGKGAKGYEAYMKLGSKAFADITAKREARAKEDQEAVHQEVGGAENWTKVQAWARENADETERAEVSKALGAGGLQARMAAAWLNSAYSRATGVSDEGIGKAATSGKGAPGETGALSPREYGRAVAEARAGFKGDFENSQVYKQLQARRSAYRGG